MNKEIEQENIYEIKYQEQKCLIKKLENLVGQSTSFITVMCKSSGRAQYDLTKKMLQEQLAKASNIKTKKTRESVEEGLNWMIETLKNERSSKTGLILFAGANDEETIKISFSPLKEFNYNCYRCDSQFYLEELKNQLNDAEVYFFVIIDGNGTLLGKVQGSKKEILKKWEVDLPRKHCKGGQSQNRFARIRIESRQNYLTLVSEMINKAINDSDLKELHGIILAGSAEFKNELLKFLPKKFQDKVIGTFTIYYGGESGFSQAIDLSESIMNNCKLSKEKNILFQLFSTIENNIFGVIKTMSAISKGVIKKVIIDENLDYRRIVLEDKSEEIVNSKNLRDLGYDIKNINYFKKQKVTENSNLLEYLIENKTELNIELEFVTDTTSEGSMFVKTFEGLAGIPKFKFDFTEIEDDETKDDSFESIKSINEDEFI